MVILHTEPINVLYVLIVAVAVLAVLFFVKILISDRSMRKIISKKPVVLIAGLPNINKTALLESLSDSGVREKRYPFVGRFRVCDVSTKKVSCRCMCFQCITHNAVLRRTSIKLLSEQPSMIIFIVKMFPDIGNVARQLAPFDALSKMYSGVPIIAAVDKYDKTGNVSMKNVRKIFDKNMIDTPLSEKSGMRKLKGRIENLLADKRRAGKKNQI